MEGPELSVVVLCYQTETELIPFVTQLEKEMISLQIPFEIILVANYDDDQDTTPKTARFFAEGKPHIRVVAKRKEGRMGWDMRSGLQSAEGKYIAVIDGDGQMPVSDIPVVYQLIKTNRFDLVKTFRLYRYDGLYRTWISKAYNFLFRLLFRPATPILDINSKPKILSRAALSKMNLQSNDWFTDAEIIIEAMRLNLRICQVATVFYQNERRPSLVKWQTIIEFIRNLFYYRFLKSNS